MRTHFPMSACRQEYLSEFVPGGELRSCLCSRLSDAHMSGTNADGYGQITIKTMPTLESFLFKRSLYVSFL